ncbi:unnamed protein product [Wuchereria bancrofti]|uniref:Uncharacterized protein n=1 Tax=Wuchereria bancrofti TaxID=6293 RepID=A0A3P7E3Q1_WUCBA|nr:unnamed protein product [Wuchereria bancrofti]
MNRYNLTDAISCFAASVNKIKYHLLYSKQLINNTLLPCSSIIYLTRQLNLVNRYDDIILSEKQLRSSVNKGESSTSERETKRSPPKRFQFRSSGGAHN